MGTLHLVSHAQALACALEVAASADAIVLLEDGVYASSVSSSLASVSPIFVVQQDLTIRGLTAPAELSCINYDELVELCTAHNPITTWC